MAKVDDTDIAGAATDVHAAATRPSHAALPRPARVTIGRPKDYPALSTVDPAHYVIEREIAHGGMGRILAARDRRLGREVALKELLVDAPDLRARFEREARITARLQHPAIVHVHEAGAWPGGEPFYVMPLVDGRSLDKVIATCAALRDRLGLLAHVIAAVDALAYAHARRIIHRDLKPQNVLVGGFGETVVIDWGLAKDLAAPSEPSPPPPTASASATGETAVGSVIGTPSYMPPEQAAGGAATEPADVYALGALLYHVLAGAAPYVATTTAEILAAVAAGPPRPLRERVPEAPRDLCTIVDKAMARAPGDRYPNASELAADLKRFQTGQLVGAHAYTPWQLVRRWVRRRRAAVAVAAIAACVLVALGALGLRRLVVERTRTEQSRADAQALVGFMLGDIGERLRAIGRLDALDAVAHRAVGYYDARGDDLSPAERTSRAEAQLALGQVLSAEGRVDEALPYDQAALATLLAQPADGESVQRTLRDAREAVGTALWAQGDLAEALVEHRAALAIDHAMSAAHAADVRWRVALVHDQRASGDDLEASGDLAGATAAYREGVAVADALVASAATKDRSAQLERAMAHDVLGTASLQQGDSAAARGEYATERAICDELIALDPADAEARRLLVLVHLSLGKTYVAAGELDHANDEMRAALGAAEVLAAADPTNTKRRREVALAHEQLAHLAGLRADYAAERSELAVARGIYEQLVARDPSNTESMDRLAQIQLGESEALVRAGEADAALAMLRASGALYDRLATRAPHRTDRRMALAWAHLLASDALLAQRDTESAVAEARSGREIIVDVSRKDPTSTIRRADVEAAEERVCQTLAARGVFPDAIVAGRAAVAVARELAGKDPRNAEWQSDLLTGETILIDTLLLAGAADEARTEIETARVTCERAGERDRLVCATLEVDDATAVEQQGKHEDAEARILRVLPALDATGRPEDARDAQALQASANTVLAKSELARGELERANEHGLAARRVAIALAQADPSNGTSRLALADVERSLADIALARHDAASAAPLADAAQASYAASYRKDLGSVRARMSLALADETVGDARGATGDARAARAAYEAALASWQQLANEHVTHPDVAKHTASVRAKLAAR